jgi:phosphatidylserine/phosphatidylglycerophosphate/cardiolipin synthase-like enzyme
VQSVVTGAPVRALLGLFVERWRVATEEDVDPAALVHAIGAHADELDVPVTLSMEPAAIGISRTMPDCAGHEPAFEVRELLVRGVTEAERSIYVESQYLTCGAFRDALAQRMKDDARSKLDVVVVLPHKPEAIKEELTIGMPQQLLLAHLDETARGHGHRFGVYNVFAPGEASVYIHAKLMIVDDRFMTVGSANFTNRSMAIDSELNLSWEGARSSIRRARVRLLLEHVGENARARDLASPVGLVDRLDAYVSAGESRLRRHEIIHERPGIVVTTMQQLACEILDPLEGEDELVPQSAA